MSTRSHVIVKDHKGPQYVYHHCDGSISGVGADLKEFISTVYSPEDYSATEFCTQLYNWDNSFEYENSGIHGDEEYLYYINLGEHNLTISAEELEVNKDAKGNYIDTWTPVSNYTSSYSYDNFVEKSSSELDGFEIIGWPDIQDIMDEEGFEENSALITPNDNLGIGSSTYLVSKEWLESLKKE